MGKANLSLRELKKDQEANVSKEGKEKKEARKQSQRQSEGWDKWLH